MLDIYTITTHTQTTKGYAPGAPEPPRAFGPGGGAQLRLPGDAPSLIGLNGIT